MCSQSIGLSLIMQLALLIQKSLDDVIDTKKSACEAILQYQS